MKLTRTLARWCLVGTAVAATVALPLSAHAAEAPTWSSSATGTLPNGVTVAMAVATAGGGSTAVLGPVQPVPPPRGQTYDPAGIASSTSAAFQFGDATAAVDGVYRPVGTLTYSFSIPVANPRIHLEQLSNGNGTTATNWGTNVLRLDLTGGLTMSALTPWPGWAVDAASIVSGLPSSGSTTPAVSCTEARFPGVSAPQGCGTIQIHGTVSSVTFAVSRARFSFGGTAPSAAPTIGYTSVSVDEDCAAVAPAASAVLSDVAIGPTVTPSLPTVLSATACTDAASPSDSGATFPTLAIQNAGTTYTATIPVSNGAGGGTGGGVAGTDPSTLAGWIDFNHDGTFDPAEMATVMVLPGLTSVDLTWTLPTDLTVGPSVVRLRIGHNAVQTASPAGMSDSGEIEESTVQVKDVVVVSPPGPVSPAELAPTGANSFTLLLAAIALVLIGTAATSASRLAARRYDSW